MKEDGKRRKLEEKIDSITDAASDRYPYSGDHQTLFDSLSLEEKVQALFTMSFRTLVELGRKADIKEDF